MRPRLIVILVLAAMAIIAGVLVTRGAQAGGSSTRQTVPRDGASFAYLATQHTNNCGMQASQLAAYSRGMRLQGSCCSAMDQAAYNAQLAGLRRYTPVRQIPKNPYDISVALARQLVGYKAAIHLSVSQQATYTRAMRMSSEKGPCCCHCWRWTAFQGMSDYLITWRGWQARPLAHLIGLVDGCGGKAAEAPHAST